MTTEEKAKAYDEAIKRGLDYIRQTPATEMVTRQDIFEAIFPEYAESESEDERMLQTIIRGFENWKRNGMETFNNTKIDDILAYLEKLGEQKYLYYDQGLVEGMRQSEFLANAEIIVSPPRITNKISVSEELYEHIREICACIDDAMSSKSLVDITDYLEMADKSAQAAFDMLEKQQSAEWSEEDEKMLKDFLHKVEVCNLLTNKENAWIVKKLKALRPQSKAEWSEDWREEDIQTRFAFYTYKDDPSVLYLSNVFVEKTCRTNGYGTRILKAAEKTAEVVGATTIRLKVKQESLANAWYRKNGYGYVSSEDGYNWLEKNIEYMKPSWKPTEEQMRALDKAIPLCLGVVGRNGVAPLESLYEQLKKLQS